MKDLYSFHADAKDLAGYFQKVLAAYQKIYRRCDLPVVVSQAGGGSIGGTETYEFQLPAAVGEDRVLVCADCHYAINQEVGAAIACPKCQRKNLQEINAIEVGHIFNLGTEYAEKMNANFTDRDGQTKPLLMGCYGIGLGRLLAAIVEAHHDERGIIWPESVAPFKVQLVRWSASQLVSQEADKVYQNMVVEGIEVLDDDREGVSAGEKFAAADIIGCPYRIVISEKTLEKDLAEVKKRGDEKPQLIPLDQLTDLFL